jgi:tRNA pseudouridine-54 N-methylase
MENKEFIKKGKNTALRISKTLALIQMNGEAVERHKQAHSPDFIIEQYQTLKERYLSELNDILQSYGIEPNMLTTLSNVA